MVLCGHFPSTSANTYPSACTFARPSLLSTLGYRQAYICSCFMGEEGKYMSLVQYKCSKTAPANPASSVDKVGPI